MKSSELVEESEASGASKAADAGGSVQQARTTRERRTGRKQPASRRRATRGSDRQRSERAEAVTVLQIEDLGSEVRIRLDKLLPWDMGMRLIQALKASGVA